MSVYFQHFYIYCIADNIIMTPVLYIGGSYTKSHDFSHSYYNSVQIVRQCSADTQTTIEPGTHRWIFSNLDLMSRYMCGMYYMYMDSKSNISVLRRYTSKKVTIVPVVTTPLSSRTSLQKPGQLFGNHIPIDHFVDAPLEQGAQIAAGRLRHIGRSTQRPHQERSVLVVEFVAQWTAVYVYRCLYVTIVRIFAEIKIGLGLHI